MYLSECGSVFVPEIILTYCTVFVSPSSVLTP